MESSNRSGGHMEQPPEARRRMPPLGGGSVEAPALVVQGVSKSYGSIQALTDVSLTIPKGSVYALVGPNGSGKTTLFKLITGLIRADVGTISVMGSVVRPGGLPPDCLGIVPEGFALYDYMTVAEHAAFAGQFSRLWDGDFVGRSLSNLDLGQSVKVGHLSQGRRAQLALILALGQRPDLLILDEPTANLDPIVRREVHRLVIGEASARGQTIVMSSHNLAEVERVADRVGFLRQGRLVAERVVDEIREQDHEIRMAVQSEVTIDLTRLPGVRGVERNGMSYRIVVHGDLEQVMAELHKLNPFVLEVVERSLEDLFFAFSAGEGTVQKEG